MFLFVGSMFGLIPLSKCSSGWQNLLSLVKSNQSRIVFVVVEVGSVTVQKKSWISVAGMAMWKGRGKHIVEQEVGKRVLIPREMQLPTKSTVRTMMLQGVESRADILTVWWGRWPCTWACGAGMTHREAARSPGSASVTAVRTHTLFWVSNISLCLFIIVKRDITHTVLSSALFLETRQPQTFTSVSAVSGSSIVTIDGELICLE